MHFVEKVAVRFLQVENFISRKPSPQSQYIHLFWGYPHLNFKYFEEKSRVHE